MKSAELEKFEELIWGYKSEKDERKKNILYLHLVEESLVYVKKIVHSMNTLPQNITRDDLVQVGALGVLRAIETYDVNGKGHYKTYVTKYIKGKILQYLRDKVSLVKTSRFVAEHYSRVKEAVEELYDNENNARPSVEEIAQYTKIPKDKIEDILNADLVKNTISLDQSVFTPDGTETLADRIPYEDNDDYEDYYENKKMLEFALNKLNKTDKHVIYRFYIEGATKKDIAQEINVSQVQVARIIKRALIKMYNIIKYGWEKEEE